VKKGDKVRALVDDADITKDKVYIIEEILENDMVNIKDDMNDIYFLYKDEYELLKEQTLKEKYMVSGMVVELRNGDMCLVVDDVILDLNGNEFESLFNYDEKMKVGFPDKFDVVKVYKRTRKRPFNKIYDTLELIWQREEQPKEMTVRDKHCQEHKVIKQVRFVKENNNFTTKINGKEWISLGAVYNVIDIKNDNYKTYYTLLDNEGDLLSFPIEIFEDIKVVE
jgi:hypothetical protein